MLRQGTNQIIEAASDTLAAFSISSILYIVISGLMAGSGVLSLFCFAPYSDMAGALFLLNMALDRG